MPRHILIKNNLTLTLTPLHSPEQAGGGGGWEELTYIHPHQYEFFINGITRSACPNLLN